MKKKAIKKKTTKKKEFKIRTTIKAKVPKKKSPKAKAKATQTKADKAWDAREEEERQLRRLYGNMTPTGDPLPDPDRSEKGWY